MEFKHGIQRLAWNIYQQHDILFMLGAAGTGKALPLNAKLYKKSGPVEMGSIAVGDEIANPDGGFSKVTGVFPQGKKKIYRIEFHDNTHVDCCEDHLWQVSSISEKWTNRVVDTKYILENHKNISGRKKLYIETCKPVGFDRKSYVINPYLMGILISEGNLTNSNCDFTSADEEILATVSSQLENGYCCKSNGLSHRIVKVNRSSKPNLYKEELKELGLWSKLSHEKFIPQSYLYGSVDQRIALLQGLMDGDGTVERTGSISYSTSSEKLAEDFCQLIYSLGGTTRIKVKENCGYTNKDGEFVLCRNSFCCYLNLPQDIKMFLLPRKLKKIKTRTKYLPKRYISNVIQLNNEVEMQCISVDHKDKLYLTDNYTVTHNSHLAMAFAIEEILNRTRQKIYLTRPVVEAGENLGFLPGPQPLDAKILTPTGWTTMGSIKVGDYVIGRDGKQTKVLGVFPKGKKMVYRFTTTDNTATECCEDHLWLTQTFEDKKRKRNGSVKSTKDIISSLLTNKGKINHFIPRNEAVEFKKTVLPLAPYVLGTLLGDGYLGNAISLASVDKEIMNRVNEEVKSINCFLTHMKNSISYNFRSQLTNNKTAKKVLVNSQEFNSVSVASKELNINLGTLKNRCNKGLVVNNVKYEFLPLENRWMNPVKNIIENLGLLGCKATTKFIPEIYKYASIDDRIALLRGLMDTDGSVNKRNGEASFTTVSHQLAKDVVELVQSLGGRALIRERNRVGKVTTIKGHKATCRNKVYEFTISLPSNINPFYISRKAKYFSCKYMHQVGIKSIDSVCEKEVQCILVENNEHLYITDQYIVTHNTLEEKINPYMMPLWDVINKICGPTHEANRTRDIVNKSYEVAPIAYLRGRTLDDAVAILDEAQNCTKAQLKLFLTRMGENSKLIITGDPKQSDLGNGVTDLIDVVKRLEPVAGVGVVYFNEQCIVRHPLVGEIIKRLEK
jgi:phosphate starvation-inducible PhoH-like protein